MSALVTCSNTRPGDRVLVQGCGGVALFAVAFAKILGAHVTVISSSDERIERVRHLGADAAVNYRTTPEWAKATRDITGGRGYDLVLELGGEKTLPQSLRCIRPGGTVAMIGILSGSAMATSLGLIITRQVRVISGAPPPSRGKSEATIAWKMFGTPAMTWTLPRLKPGATETGFSMSTAPSGMRAMRWRAALNGRFWRA